MSFAPTRTVDRPDPARLPAVLMSLVLLVLALGIAAHVVALAMYG